MMGASTWSFCGSWSSLLWGRFQRSWSLNYVQGLVVYSPHGAVPTSHTSRKPTSKFHWRILSPVHHRRWTIWWIINRNSLTSSDWGSIWSDIAFSKWYCNLSPHRCPSSDRICRGFRCTLTPKFQKIGFYHRSIFFRVSLCEEDVFCWRVDLLEVYLHKWTI